MIPALPPAVVSVESAPVAPKRVAFNDAMFEPRNWREQQDAIDTAIDASWGPTGKSRKVDWLALYMGFDSDINEQSVVVQYIDWLK